MLNRLPVISFIFLIITVFQAAAIPAHPGNTNPTGRERPPALGEAAAPLYSPLFKSSSAPNRSAPSAGQVKVLVILADFGKDVATFPPAAFPDSIDNNNSGSRIINPLFPLFSVLYALFLFFPGRKRKWILPLPAAVSVMILASCPSGSGIDYGDPLYFKSPSTISLYKGILETNPDPYLTMKKYYYDMSNGNLDLTFDIKGPYRVSKGWQYYGANDSEGYDLYPATFVGEAIDLAEEDGVDFSVYTTVDGALPTVIVIHAGMGEEFAGDEDTIWSHNWSLSTAAKYRDGSGKRYYDGVYIDNYTIQPEYNKYAGDATIGVFCHEFGHVLGLPDLYDTTGETNGVGEWSLMGGGSWGSDDDGKDPAPLLAWERDRVGGTAWIAITPATGGTYSGIEDIETSKTAYKVALDTNQYLLLEKKTESGSDTKPYVPVDVDGILITHIHEGIIASYMNSNKVNAGDTRVHGVNIVEAGNTNTSGIGYLWTKSSVTPTDYLKMPFPDGAINSLVYSDIGSTQPNANYYTSEAITSKTGDPGKSITINSSTSFTIGP